MSKDPVFVTGLTIARSQDFVVAALYAPTGEFRTGRLEAGESFRVVMSLSTLRAVADTINSTLREIDRSGSELRSSNRTLSESLVDDLKH